jgi:hypothetical protein
VILAAGGALSLLFFVFNEQMIRLVFGSGYQAAAPLLGWMGVAMIGVSLSSVWLNYYLAERPRSFVLLLGFAVLLQWTLLNLLPSSLTSAVLAFGATGWLLAAAGLVLYTLNLGRLPRRTTAVSH